MALGAENMQTAQFSDAFAQPDVRAAPGHVGGDGHMTGLAGLGDDFSFTGVLLGVEYIVGDAFLPEHGRKQL